MFLPISRKQRLRTAGSFDWQSDFFAKGKILGEMVDHLVRNF